MRIDDKLYEHSSPTELHTDASIKGLAGMLLQQDRHKEWHLVYCARKRTTEAESNSHSVELMGIVWAFERLRFPLLGIPCALVTDCQAVVYVNTHRTLKP